MKSLKLWTMPVIAVMVLAMTMTGCLTVEQQVRMNELQTKMENSAVSLRELQPILESAKAKIDEIKADFKAGRIPVDKFLELSTMAQQQYSTVAAKIAEVQGVIADTKKQITDLHSEGVPWWTIAINLLLAGAGIYFKVKQSGATAIANTESLKTQSCVLGLEKAKVSVADYLLANGVDEKIIAGIGTGKLLTKDITNEAILNNVETSLHADVRNLT